MKNKILVLLAAIFCAVGASPGYGQFGFTPIKRPNIANIFHPVVGGGAAYELTSKTGGKSMLELSIVGKEMIGAQQGYWMEMGHSKKDSTELMYAKSLVTPDDFRFHKMVMVMPGSTQPMEMNLDATNAHRETMDKNLEKWHSVGTESVTVPAGTFSCEHWTKDDGKGDVWVSSKVSPMGLVKSVDDGQTMLLSKVITDAQSHIIGTPVKFDPQQMRQQMQMRPQKP